MDISQFLAEFPEEEFPHEFGPWIGLDAHDPPFKMKELKEMKKAGMIQLDKDNKRYRLTLKATHIAELIAYELNSADDAK